MRKCLKFAGRFLSPVLMSAFVTIACMLVLGVLLIVVPPGWQHTTFTIVFGSWVPPLISGYYWEERSRSHAIAALVGSTLAIAIMACYGTFFLLGMIALALGVGGMALAIFIVSIRKSAGDVEPVVSTCTEPENVFPKVEPYDPSIVFRGTSQEVSQFMYGLYAKRDDS